VLVSPTSPLVERLLAHRTLGSAPLAELEWLAARCEMRDLPPGGVLTSVKSGTVEGLFVVLSGRLSIHVDHGAGPRKVMEWQGGDITGVLPYSRIKGPPADVVAEEPTTAALLPRDQIDALTRECPTLTAICVHVMLDRARVFTSSDLLDEKMVSLGRLAAGMAHELNNPASAVARTASSLSAALGDLARTTRAFCGMGLSDEQAARVEAVRASVVAAPPATLTPIETADREDAIAGWLDAHAASRIDANQVVEAGWTVDHLDQLASAVGAGQVGAALGYLSTDESVRRMAADLERAACRIHDLVSAVKRFTYMDQAMVAAPINLAQGLRDTVTMLRSKAREKNADLKLDLEPDLPMVEAFGGELNQVWTNLIDNALDAVPRGGRVAVSATYHNHSVVVRVVDNGPGIPAEIQGRIFDPFFTTKGVGKGTGLGLDIARRLVLRHRGEICVKSSSDGTEFEVTIPVATKAVAP
jgi:signal transduction histidine kinase